MGLTLVPWAKGKSLVWDFTCADTLAPSYISQTANHPGAAARIRATAKNIKFHFLKERFHFIPIAIETFGVYGLEADKFISALGDRLKVVTQDKRSLAFLKQRISSAIQRGNAAAVLGTLPSGKGFTEIFNL